MCSNLFCPAYIHVFKSELAVSKSWAILGAHDNLEHSKVSPLIVACVVVAVLALIRFVTQSRNQNESMQPNRPLERLVPPAPWLLQGWERWMFGTATQRQSAGNSILCIAGLLFVGWFASGQSVESIVRLFVILAVFLACIFGVSRVWKTASTQLQASIEKPRNVVWVIAVPLALCCVFHPEICRWILQFIELTTKSVSEDSSKWFFVGLFIVLLVSHLPWFSTRIANGNLAFLRIWSLFIVPVFVFFAFQDFRRSGSLTVQTLLMFVFGAWWFNQRIINGRRTAIDFRRPGSGG